MGAAGKDETGIRHLVNLLHIERIDPAIRDGRLIPDQDGEQQGWDPDGVDDEECDGGDETDGEAAAVAVDGYVRLQNRLPS